MKPRYKDGVRLLGPECIESTVDFYIVESGGALRCPMLAGFKIHGRQVRI